MAGWSDLSTALKRNVIGRMDLMSRYAFRCSNRENRTIVDSTDFFIPRARFSIKSTGYLIVVHSGIDDWLRVEIEKDDGETVIMKSQNSWKPEDVVETFSPYIMLDNAVLILMTLLCRKAILIDALEVEIEGGADAEEEDQEESIKKCTMKMVELVNKFRQFAQCNHLFRVRKLVTGWNSYPEVESVIRLILYPDVLECYERLSLSVAPDYQTPMFCTDSCDPTELLGKPQRTSTIQHSENLTEGLGIKDTFMVFASITPGFATIRFPKKIPCAQKMWDNVNGRAERISEKLIRKEETISFPLGNVYMAHFRTICGYWAHAVPIRNRSQLDAFLKSFYEEHNKTGVCGLDWLCKRCTNAFDYDYYQNIGRRVYLEPEWSGIQVHGTMADGGRDYEDAIVRAARRMYAKKAEDTPMNPKTSEKKSWGFRKDSEDSEDLDLIVEGLEDLKIFEPIPLKM